jgi:hypothetical protein
MSHSPPTSQREQGAEAETYFVNRMTWERDTNWKGVSERHSSSTRTCRSELAHLGVAQDNEKRVI